MEAKYWIGSLQQFMVNNFIANMVSKITTETNISRKYRMILSENSAAGCNAYSRYFHLQNIMETTGDVLPVDNVDNYWTSLPHAIYNKNISMTNMVSTYIKSRQFNTITNDYFADSEQQTTEAETRTKAAQNSLKLKARFGQM
eukprot:14849315-Ditylum_brightwellii.AAC.1